MIILTNNHVVRDEEVVKVHFSHGSEHLADVIRRFGLIETPLLKNADGPNTVPSLSFCYGHKPSLGESVVAIGNPLANLGTTVTRGIISGSTGS